jgi:hypothetical protein
MNFGAVTFQKAVLERNCTKIQVYTFLNHSLPEYNTFCCDVTRMCVMDQKGNTGKKASERTRTIRFIGMASKLWRVNIIEKITAECQYSRAALIFAVSCAQCNTCHQNQYIDTLVK